MLGLIIVFFIGKYFYQLGGKYEKSKWGVAVLGVVAYYFGSIVIGGVSIGLAHFIFEFDMDFNNSTMLGILAIPFGILFAYLVHWLLEKKWKKNKELEAVSIDDIGSDNS